MSKQKGTKESGTINSKKASWRNLRKRVFRDFLHVAFELHQTFAKHIWPWQCEIFPDAQMEKAVDGNPFGDLDTRENKAPIELSITHTAIMLVCLLLLRLRTIVSSTVHRATATNRNVLPLIAIFVSTCFSSKLRPFLQAKNRHEKRMLFFQWVEVGGQSCHHTG